MRKRMWRGKSAEREGGGEGRGCGGRLRRIGGGQLRGGVAPTAQSLFSENAGLDSCPQSVLVRMLAQTIAPMRMYPPNTRFLQCLQVCLVNFWIWLPQFRVSLVRRLVYTLAMIRMPLQDIFLLLCLLQGAMLLSWIP